MTCPLCGYMMSAFDKECPRCHGKGIAPPTPPPAPVPPPPPSQTYPPQSYPQQQYPQQPPVVVQKPSGFGTGLGGGLGAGIGCCCLFPILLWIAITVFFGGLGLIGANVSKDFQKTPTPAPTLSP